MDISIKVLDHTSKEARGVLQMVKNSRDKREKNSTFDPDGQKIFQKGNNYIFYDIDDYQGSFWKMFKGERRLGTFDKSLKNMLRE